MGGIDKQIHAQKGTKVRVRADVLNLGPQSKELQREQESGYRLEDPVGRGGSVSEENEHGCGEVALEGFPGQRVGFYCGFSVLLVKAGWALLKL